MDNENSSVKKRGCCGGKKNEEKHNCRCGEKHADSSRKNEKKQK